MTKISAKFLKVMFRILAITTTRNYPYYSGSQQIFRKNCNQQDQTNLHLSVAAPSGEVIQCAGVGILDCGRDIEVNVLGISYPPYAELFPQHVAQYEASLK